MANLLDPFQPFSQKHLALLTMPSLSLAFVGAARWLTHAASILPFEVPRCPSLSLHGLGPGHPTADMGISFSWLKELVQDVYTAKV